MKQKKKNRIRNENSLVFTSRLASYIYIYFVIYVNKCFLKNKN